MKCICGYEKLYDYQTDDCVEVGDKEFIRIDCFGKPFETSVKTPYYCSSDYQTTYLYACPKCGVIKVNINELDI